MGKSKVIPKKDRKSKIIFSKSKINNKKISKNNKRITINDIFVQLLKKRNLMKMNISLI